MPYTVRKVGKKYVLYVRGKKVGTHRSRAAANRQRAAIWMRKHGRSRRR